MMTWTDPDLANAVKQAHNRGVLVEVVATDFAGVYPSLVGAGIPILINRSFSLMHNKFMYVDDTIFVNGSANWSKSSFTRNDESFVVIDEVAPEQREILNAYWNYLKP